MVSRNVFFIGLVVSGIYWYFVGVFATGEPDLLSTRVSEVCTQSQFGLMFCSWFYPGPGRGFMFVIGNFLSTFLLGVGFCFGSIVIPRGSSQQAD